MREGTGLLGAVCDFVENDAPCLIKLDATAYQILSKGSFKAQPIGDVINRSYAFAFMGLGLRDQSFHVGLGVHCTRYRLRSDLGSRSRVDVFHISPLWVGGVVPVHDASAQRVNRTEAGRRIGPDRDRGNLKRGPVDCTPDFRRIRRLSDFIAMNLIANGHCTQMSRLDVIPNIFDVITLTETHACNTKSLFNASSARNDGTDDAVEIT